MACICCVGSWADTQGHSYPIGAMSFYFGGHDHGFNHQFECQITATEATHVDVLEVIEEEGDNVVCVPLSTN